MQSFQFLLICFLQLFTIYINLWLSCFLHFFAVHYLGCFLHFFFCRSLPRLLFRLFAISMNLPRLLFTLFSPAFSKSLKSSRRKIKLLKNYLAASAASAAPAAFWCSRWFLREWALLSISLNTLLFKVISFHRRWMPTKVTSYHFNTYKWFHKCVIEWFTYFCSS